MVINFLKELKKVWVRQDPNWRTVVIRQIFNRFINRMTLQYSNIYIRELGASPVELGTVNSASGIGQTLISLPLGYLQDKYSIRKIFLTGVAVLTLVPLLYATATSWEFVIPAILLAGLGLRLGSCVVICDLCLSNRDRATGKALCEGIGAIPGLFAPIVAATLITWFGGLNTEGIRPLFWIQFIVRLALFIYVYRNLTEIERPEIGEKEFNPLRDMKEVFERGTAIKRWIVFYSLNLFTGSMLVTFRYPFAEEVKGAGAFIIGGIATLMTLTEAIFSTPMGRMADKVGRKRLFYILTPLFSLANIVFILAPSPNWLLLGGTLMGFRLLAGFAYGSMTPELVPKDCIGRWRGVLGLTAGLASIPAPIIGGLIWDRLGPEWIFITATLIDIVIRLPILYTVPETLKREKTA